MYNNDNISDDGKIVMSLSGDDHDHDNDNDNDNDNENEIENENENDNVANSESGQGDTEQMALLRNDNLLTRSTTTQSERGGVGGNSSGNNNNNNDNNNNNNNKSKKAAISAAAASFQKPRLFSQPIDRADYHVPQDSSFRSHHKDANDKNSSDKYRRASLNSPNASPYTDSFHKDNTNRVSPLEIADSTPIEQDPNHWQAEPHTEMVKPKKGAYERLNCNQPETEYIHRKSFEKRKQSRRGMYKWFLCLVIGCATGTVMFGISIAINELQTISLNWAKSGLQSSWWLGCLHFSAVNLGYSLFAACLVLFIAPAAGGSGIPEVKAWLNGTLVPNFFDMSTLFVKCIGLCFSVAASLAVGKEGPMVHIGSAIASAVTLGRNKPLKIDIKAGYAFRNDADARDFISAGAAAGVAAGFSAPIGGMLFALEEVSSFWQPGLTWRAFFAATVSNLVLQLLLGCANDECGSFSKSNLIDFQNSSTSALGKFNYADLGFFLLIGIIGGLVGISFNTVNIRILRWRKTQVKDKWRKLAEVVVVSLITSFCILGLPLFFDCKSSSNIEENCGSEDDSPCSSLITFGRFTCEEGYYNPAASLLFGKSESIISSLFHPQSRDWFPLQQVILCFAAYYILVLLACGTAVPAGLFIPLIMLGATLGHGMGQAYNEVFGLSLDIGVYALLGAAATLGGVTRMTISLTAILLEITNDIYYLMPIMIVVMVSKWIGDRFNTPLYDSHVALKGMPYLEPKLPSWVPTYITAHDIMRPDVVTLPAICSLRVLLRVINDPNHQHSAFAVLEGPQVQPKELMKNNNEYTQRSGAFAGMVLRWHIMILLYNKHYGTPEKLLKFTRKNILTQAQMTDRTWKNKLHVTLDELNVRDYELDMMFIDLSPYIYLSPITVSPHTPINIIYSIFRGLAMRHLICLDENEKIAGVITCHELVESNMEEVVRRVHRWFDMSSDSNEMFEQRLRFLKNYDTFLLSSGNEWLNANAIFQNAENLSRSASRHKSEFHKHWSKNDEYTTPLISAETEMD